MIILLHGPDTFRLLLKRNEIVKRHQKLHRQSLSLEKYDLAQDASAKLLNIERTLKEKGLFGGKRLVLLSSLNSLSKVDQERLKVLLEENKAHLREDVFMLICEQQSLKKIPGRLARFLFQKAKTQSFDLLSHPEVKRWVQGRLLGYGGKIKLTQEALEILVRITGSDLWRLNGELEKLISYAKSRGISLIGKKEVTSLVVDDQQEQIFRLLEALARGDKKSALHHLALQFRQGEAEQRTLTMIQYQLRVMLCLRDLLDQGYSHYKLPQALPELHPFVVKKNTPLSRNFSLDTLKKIHSRLYELELSFKSSSVLSSRFNLEIFLADLSQPRR